MIWWAPKKQSFSRVPEDELKKNTINSYRITLSKFSDVFGNGQLDAISSEEILTFLTSITEGTKQATKHSRYSHLRSFFNFMRETLNPNLQNPCDKPMLKKLFRPARAVHWNIIEKETIDEVIFRTTEARNRLLLELMARGGMRVSEVLNLTPNDVDGRRLIIRDSKGGRGEELVFIPPKLAARFKEYISERRIEPGQRIFSITYAAARLVVKKAGELVGIHLRPHDLRRHSATYASRAGTPIEIVSKVILRH
ncbi:MAG: tyrosine-type recombinase/integrase, partial [Deltaproteobacteria bacterium]|nr:tyrosine-type recombinase/integrase [Deltaproteobacteria bacterium]